MRVAVTGLGLLVMLSGCESISSLDCAEVAERARALSGDQPLPVRSFANVRETSRTETELRCTGDATFADGGTAPLHFRARVEEREIVVAYQGIAFE